MALKYRVKKTNTLVSCGCLEVEKKLALDSKVLRVFQLLVKYAVPI